MYVCVFFGGERELTFLSFSHLLPSLYLFLNFLSRSRSRSRSLALLASFNVISLNFWEQALQCVCVFFFLFSALFFCLFKLICFFFFSFYSIYVMFYHFFNPYLFFHLFTNHFALLTVKKKSVLLLSFPSNQFSFRRFSSEADGSHSL